MERSPPANPVSIFQSLEFSRMPMRSILTEAVVVAAHGVGGAIRGRLTRDSPRKISRTAYQALPLPTPTTLIGEQVRPIGMLMSWRMTPMAARMGVMPRLSDDWTDSQHWSAPVEQELVWGVGLATARIASAVNAVKAAVVLANMLLESEVKRGELELKALGVNYGECSVRNDGLSASLLYLSNDLVRYVQKCIATCQDCAEVRIVLSHGRRIDQPGGGEDRCPTASAPLPPRCILLDEAVSHIAVHTHMYVLISLEHTRITGPFRLCGKLLLGREWSTGRWYWHHAKHVARATLDTKKIPRRMRATLHAAKVF